jgi:recombination protein RecR
MDELTKLAQYFKKFPGIGERQAKRFVYFLLASDRNYVDELKNLIGEIKKNVSRCTSCYRFFRKSSSPLCDICNNPKRDKAMLMVIEKDADLESIERSKVYKGMYFILGGLVPLVEKETPERVRVHELQARINADAETGTLKEIILAFSLSPQGDHTDTYLKEILSQTVEKYKLKIASLGKGLSTGTELEYSDQDTLKNAL